jgi:hypothetical protein
VKGAEPSRVGKEPAKNTDEEVRKYTKSIIRICLIGQTVRTLFEVRLRKKYQVYRLDPKYRYWPSLWIRFLMDPDPEKYCGSGASVADPGCLSRIPDPDFYPSRLPDLGSRTQDPKTATKGRSEKKISLNFLCSHKFHKILNYFSFEVLKKKIWANFQRIKELFTPNIVTKLSKIWVWDPGSEIRDPEKTYTGSRGQKGTGSRIRIRNTVRSSTKPTKLPGNMDKR